MKNGTTPVKPEHMTSLDGAALVAKTHPRMELRGRLDGLIASVIELQILAEERDAGALVVQLEEIREELRHVIAAEVGGIPCRDLRLWGLSSDELHERSHHPARYFSLGHILPHHTMGKLAAALNKLRAEVRGVELAACRAFEIPEGTGRPDIVKTLNRLSSALYILTYEYLPEGYDKIIAFGTKKSDRKDSSQ